MIKKTLLDKLFTNANELADYPVSYAEAYSIAVIRIHGKMSGNVDDLCEELRNDGKRVTEYYFVEKIEKGKSYPDNSFNSADISLLGKIQSSRLNDFCDQKFDFLLLLDTEGDKMLKFIASKSKARHKIGLYHTNYEGILTMMVKPKSKKDSCSDLMKYLKMIQHV